MLGTKVQARIRKPVMERVTSTAGRYAVLSEGSGGLNRFRYSCYAACLSKRIPSSNLWIELNSSFLVPKPIV